MTSRQSSVLRASRSIARTFATLTPVPTIWLDASFSVLIVSDSYLKLAQSNLEDCVGQNIYSLVTGKGLFPDACSLKHTIDKAITCRNVSITEKQEGHIHWDLRAVPIFENDALIYMSLEIQNTTAGHHKRQAVNDQLDTNDTYKILVETVKDYAIFMLDTQGNVKTWNAGAALLKGYTPDEIIGKHFSVFYGEEDLKAEKPKRELEICMRVGKVEDESWRYRKDGSRFWANVTIACIYRNGVHIGFSKVTRDLTERKAAESKVITAYEESAQLKAAFLANTSHEIRTPLHGMLSALTLLMDSPLTPEQKELTGVIEESGSILLQVINDILDFSKLASGTFPISSDRISVEDIVRSVVRSFQPSLKFGVSITTSTGPNLPKTAQGDPLRYRQIVQNLISNSVKFTDSGSININVSLEAENDISYTVRTEVADTGIGIPETAILFTPFTQFDTSATRRYKGTGLGLSICKSLAELMGGSIGFRANPERGSIFWFTVKMQKLNIPPQLEVQPQHLDSATLIDPIAKLRLMSPSYRLLLVEDNVINLKVMLMMLKGLGFAKVDTAVNGAEAVALTTQNPFFYDLVLMDINMPVLDGVGATLEMRRQGLGIPVVAMTANALQENVDLYLANGMNDYVPRPVDRKFLVRTLLKWLK